MLQLQEKLEAAQEARVKAEAQLETEKAAGKARLENLNAALQERLQQVCLFETFQQPDLLTHIT